LQATNSDLKMEENLLSQEEILLIEETVSENPFLRNPNVSSFGDDRTSIFKVTPINGLILIVGDQSTGFKHINDRHSFWSQEFYWLEKDNKIILDDPSKFSRKSIPILDYSEISDRLFENENLNLVKNKRPDFFDMYVGFVEDSLGEKLEYRMLLYKNTKIVHTLFPEKRVHNKKKHINLIRDKAKGQFLFKDSVLTLAVGFKDHKDYVSFSFQVIRELLKNKETGILINHKSKIQYKLFERQYESVNDLKTELEIFDRADFSQIEKIIKKMDK
jgi:hypothetical protein